MIRCPWWCRWLNLIKISEDLGVNWNLGEKQMLFKSVKDKNKGVHCWKHPTMYLKESTENLNSGLKMSGGRCKLKRLNMASDFN